MPGNTSTFSKEGALPTNRQAEETDFPVVGIGASAGGLEAFKQFFAAMPGEPGMAFVLVPHLDPHYKSIMVDILSNTSQMPVREINQATPIEINHIYIIQPNHNIVIEENLLVPTAIFREQGINLPVDIFFRSMALAKKELAIGIILSGTMRDGSLGLKDIKEFGGLVIAQSPGTAQHCGMPQSAIETGLVDLILSIEKMPEVLLAYSRHPYIRGGSVEDREQELQQVLAIIHTRSNNDFGCYKKNTLLRRTERRMGLAQIQSITEYATFLRNHPQELDALLKDLLIGVTGFFRDPKVWEALQNNIIPSLMAADNTGAFLRVWVPGCSTGEEAFTMAMILFEACEKAGQPFGSQIFASDIDTRAINTARLGIYPETIADSIPPDWLKKYFFHEGTEYRIKRHIRESVVFAEQNLLYDAPFSNLDLISCRNLLIYLKPEVQKKILELFHFALRPEGCLILGSSETIGSRRSLFEVISKENCLYRRLSHTDKHRQQPNLQFLNRHRAMGRGRRQTAAPKSVSEIMHNQLIKHFAPAAVLIKKNFEILHLHGPTTRYLELPQGEPVMDLIAMIKDGLRIKLRAAVHKVVKDNMPATVDNVRIKRDNSYFRVSFTVVPVKEVDIEEPLYLVSFVDQPAPKEEVGLANELDPGEESLVEQLESELADTKLELKISIEEMETSNEELKASNEEMMSMNEELQSSNEELETSKEELQSMNEELSSVNAELQDKIRLLEKTELSLRQSERELQKKSELLAAVLEHTHMMAVYLDPDFNFLWVNKAYADTCQKDPSFFPGKNHFKLYPNDENKAIFQSVAQTAKAFFCTGQTF